MIANPSFELPAGPLQTGAPSGWVVTTVGTGEDTAPFAGDLAADPAGTESFEHGWGTRNPQAIVTSPDVESRETEIMSTWISLGGGLPALSLVLAEAASFDSHTSAVELFESWVSGADTDQQFAPEELQAAAFASGGSETFAWSVFESTFGSVEANDFSNGDAMEMFLVRPKQEVLVDLDANRLYRRDMQNFVGSTDERYTIETTDTLPTPFRDERLYYVIDTAGPYVGLSPTEGGDYVAITDIGNGTQYLVADPDEFWTYAL